MSRTTDLVSVAAVFDTPNEFIESSPLSGGHINESHIVSYRIGESRRRYLLQRINNRVFPKPEWVVDNIHDVTKHLARRLREAGCSDVDRRVIQLVPTRRGDWTHRDPRGSCWRMFHWIEETRTHETAGTPKRAEQAGRAFGAFQRRLADYDGAPLHIVLPGFHDAVCRLAALETAARIDSLGRAAAVRTEVAHVLDHRRLAAEHDGLRRDRSLPERIVHNDAKISNVLFDTATDEAVCVVDLDTVMPGLAAHDFGDMVRSMTTACAEDEPNLDRVAFELPLFEALARGYLDEVRASLSPVERQHLVSGARLIVLEQAARFLTDYLDGDHYYKTTRPSHNLDRCRVQLRLFEQMSLRTHQLNTIVAKC